ncbi:MAG: pyrroline-5-carboxylate reductase family protein [Mycobacterium leprae]
MADNYSGKWKVAIIGAGHLGSLLASRMPGSTRKVIISADKAQAQLLADEVGGVAADSMSAVRGCRAVFLALAGQAVRPAVQEIAPHLSDAALVVNMCRDVTTIDLASEFPQLRFAAAKVIGHPREMSMGSPGVVVLDHVQPDDEELLHALLEGLGHTIHEREATVNEAMKAVADVMTRAEAELRKRLVEIGLGHELAQAAVATAGPGVLRALAEGSADGLRFTAEEGQAASEGERTHHSH